MTITETRFRYEGADGTGLAGFVWRGGAQPKAVLQLAHGAGEHAGRYLGPMAPIIDAGYVIYTADHRGHGLTSGMTSLGDFGPGGAPAAVDDMAVLSRRARAENPDLPLILMGHSMGAMFAQAYILDHSNLIDALVLSGTTGPGPRPAGGRTAATPTRAPSTTGCRATRPRSTSTSPTRSAASASSPTPWPASWPCASAT